jgi:hypothetical protein
MGWPAGKDDFSTAFGAGPFCSAWDESGQKTMKNKHRIIRANFWYLI